MTARLLAAPLRAVTVTVEVAWAADVSADSATWTWSDISADVLQNPGIQTKLGRGNEAARSQPATMSITLSNADGAYSRGGLSANYPYVRQGVPVRVRVDPDDGAGQRVLFLGFAAGWTPTWDAAGGVAYVELEAAGTLRRLQGVDTPVPSAYRRTVTNTASVLAYWPMEEQRGAQVAYPVRGGQPMQPGNPAAIRWATSDDFESSDKLPDVGTSNLLAVVTPYTGTGASQVRFFLLVPDDGLTDGTVLAYVYTTGTLARFDIVYSSAGTGNMGVYVYNQDGSLNSSTPSVTFDMNGNRRRVELQLTESGGSVTWTLGVLDADPGDTGGNFGATIGSRTFGTVSQVMLAPGGAKGTIYGHLTVQNAVTSTFEAKEAFWAWQRRLGSLSTPELPSSGTTSASRLDRLMTENGLVLDRHTGALASDLVNLVAEGMGPQLPRTLLALLQECETVDQGQLWDGRTAGLSYTTRRYREDGVTALTLDAGAGGLFQPFEPTDDDQRTRNRVTATRTAGVTATYEDVTGPRGTDAIGVYDSSLNYNGFSDNQVIQYAAFQVSLGTVDGYRYPTVTVDLLGRPELAGDVLDLIPGDRVSITNGADALLGFPAGDVDLIVEAIAHRMSEQTWKAILTCTWGDPWFAGRVADITGDSSEYVLRADTDGATLAAGAARSSTTLSVATPSGPLWTTVADDFPLYLDVGGVRVRATACSGSSSPQTFTVDALGYDRASGTSVKLWNQRPLGLGRSGTP